mmetsp:Transcript_3041/g.9173  ORF Transcript_3041/g.9173 Transcript_3041/m.9173 type:complete len:278 (+) Transcript_3041:741-1574(+)
MDFGQTLERRVLLDHQARDTLGPPERQRGNYGVLPPLQFEHPRAVANWLQVGLTPPGRRLAKGSRCIQQPGGGCGCLDRRLDNAEAAARRRRRRRLGGMPRHVPPLVGYGFAPSAEQPVGVTVEGLHCEEAFSYLPPPHLARSAPCARPAHCRLDSACLGLATRMRALSSHSTARQLPARARLNGGGRRLTLGRRRHAHVLLEGGQSAAALLAKPQKKLFDPVEPRVDRSIGGMGTMRRGRAAASTTTPVAATTSASSASGSDVASGTTATAPNRLN